MDFSGAVTGFDDLAGIMARLPNAMKNKALRPALKAGGQETKKDAIRNVKRLAVAGYSKGVLARSITVRNGKLFKGQLRVIVAVTPGKTYSDGTRVGLVGSVFEFGRVKGHGKNRNSQKPMPWLRPAASTSAPRVFSVVQSVASRNLYAAVEAAR